MTIIKNTYQKLLSLYLLGLVIFWIALRISGYTMGSINFLYSFYFGLIPLLGGLVGMFRSKIWGRFKSSLGKSVFFISLGLFCWGFGETIWSYYNFFKHVAAPYPSVADVGFAASIVFWAVGAIFLSRASGARSNLTNSKWAKLFAATVPVVILVVSYYLLVIVARSGVLVPPGETMLKIILDIAYPFGDFISLTLALVIFGLSFKKFGGYYKVPLVSILAGLGVMYFADFIFSYTTTTGTFYNGDWGDLVLTFGLFLITFGVLGFASAPKFTHPQQAATSHPAFSSPSDNRQTSEKI